MFVENRDFSPGEQTKGPTTLQQDFEVLRERHLVFKHLGTLPRFLNPLWHLEHYRCHRQISQILIPHIQRAQQDQDQQDSKPLTTRPKTVVDLALKEVNQEQQQQQVPSQELIKDVVGLIKQFIFAGHDTTAITLSFAYHFLTRHPDAMRRLRQEHDDVFGKDDVDQMPAKLRAAPHLINSLPFTAAVVKETLRLCPGTVFFSFLFLAKTSSPLMVPTGG